MKSKNQYIRLLSDFQKKRGASYGINHLGIFGSVARDEQKQGSDLDIYYDGDAMSLIKLGTLKEELENLLDCPVDIVRKRNTMNQMLKNRILKDGIHV